MYVSQRKLRFIPQRNDSPTQEPIESQSAKCLTISPALSIFFLRAAVVYIRLPIFASTDRY